MLHGRAAERARLERLLADARSGRSGALLIAGPAGSGKTALLADTVARAAGFEVLRTVGVEDESQISFSGLDELVSPVLHLVDTLAQPQKEALRAAFDLKASPKVARGAAFRAALNVLTAAAEARPLLCVVDDAHLLDPASASALAFAARRIKAEGIAMVFAAEDGRETPFAGLDELLLEGLDAGAARELLEAGAGVHVAADVARRLTRETGGSPRALVAAAAGLSEDELSGRAPLRYPLPIGTDAVRHLDSTPALSPAAQAALVAAAAADTQALRAIAKDGAVAGVTVEALEECEAAALIEFAEGSVRFRHPLVRAAVYQAAPPPRQRAAHRALAAASSGERRALHLAAAATGPDEEVAAELEQAGESAERRSCYLVAASWFTRAASFSPGPADGARRLYRAAEAAWRGGQPARAEELANQAADALGDAPPRADVEHLRARIELESGREQSGYRRLLAEAARIGGADPVQMSRLLTSAVAAAPPDERIVMARRAYELAPRDGDEAELHATLTLARALLAAGDYRKGVALLAHARSLLDANDALAADPDALLAAADAFVVAERSGDPVVHTLATRAVAIARERGALSALPRALVQLAHVETTLGRWGDAYTAASEAAELAGDAGQETSRADALAVLGRLDALRGRADDCRRHLAALGASRRTSEATTLGLLAAGTGDAEEAISQFTRGPAEWTPDLVEAYVRAGRIGEAKRVAAVTTAVQASGRPSTRAGAAWARALVADEDSYDEAFAETVAALERFVGDDSFDLARLRLNWGERLRRSGRRREARERLRAAHDCFELLGAEPWAERARAELRATGETARRRNPGSVDELTPQELHVAREIAAGATYREAARKLFLSPKTIEFHLRKVYRKLGVTSRQQLSGRLETLESERARAEGA